MHAAQPRSLARWPNTLGFWLFVCRLRVQHISLVTSLLSLVYVPYSATQNSVSHTPRYAGTGLYELWKAGLYRNYHPDRLVDLVAR